MPHGICANPIMIICPITPTVTNPITKMEVACTMGSLFGNVNEATISFDSFHKKNYFFQILMESFHNNSLGFFPCNP